MTGYTWDVQNQLTRIDFPDLTFAAYRYDGLGRGIEKDVAGAVTCCVYDGSELAWPSPEVVRVGGASRFARPARWA